ncbi:MAG: aminotransferase class IV [Acidimicrobiales bacterium]|nr:aminotransferase class IV [Acidimicrobiales bacterium]
MDGVAPPPPSGAYWVDGEIVAAGVAAVSPVDHAIIVGDGVFETLKVIDGTPFALTRHLGRLKRSADGLGLPEPDDAVVRVAVAETLAVDPKAERLRITWSSGPGPLGSDRGGGPGTLLVASSPGTVWPETVRVHLCEWTRNERGALTGLKTTSYAENVRALEAAHQRGASEALLTNTQGQLCEGTGTNVFLVVDGALVTPPLSSGCLAGITRELVLELADVVERDVDPTEFAEASEAFLTSSTREVGAISAVDDTVLPEAPGPVTAELTAAFADLVATNPDP